MNDKNIKRVKIVLSSVAHIPKKKKRDRELRSGSNRRDERGSAP